MSGRLILDRDDRKALRRRATWIRDQLGRVSGKALDFYRAELIALDKVLADQDDRIVAKLVTKFGITEDQARARLEHQRRENEARGHDAR